MPTGTRDSLADSSALPRRRAIVLAHHDRDGGFDPHVRHALESYRRIATRLVVVSNGGGRLPPSLAGIVDAYLPRPNLGYDFCAWRDGLATLDRTAYDEVLCVNDSVYGPLFDIGPALDSRRTAGADLWGMVASDQACGRGKPRRWHLQSWFFGMRRRLLDSGTFDDFWSSVRPLPSKADVVERFEVGLSTRVIDAGFTAAAVYDASTAPRVRLHELVPHVSLAAPRRSWRLVKKSRRPAHNPSELVWWRLLEAGVPFVKVGLFRVNHYGLHLPGVLAGVGRTTAYDVGLIRGHLARVG